LRHPKIRYALTTETMGNIMLDKANPALSPKTKLPLHRKTNSKAGDPTIPPPVHTQAAVENPTAVPAADILALQRQYGNQAVHRLIQRKVTVGAANDPLEVEADRMADKVMSTPAPADVHRAAPEEEELQTSPSDLHRAVEEDEIATKRADIFRAGEEDEIATKRADIQRAGEEDELATKRLDIQRAAPEEEEIQTQRSDIHRAAPEEEEIQTKPQGKDWRDSFEAGPAVEDQLRQNSGGGSPLPGDVRGFMETRFGADFGGVRVHADSGAADLNRQLSAQAFTHGNEIYMGEGKYEPSSNDGKRLLAHELTHVVQQGGAAGVQRQESGDTTVQRYTMASMSQPGPINWQQETTSVTRPDEGVSGGVFFFHSDEEVVVKPERDSSPSAVRALEKTLQGANVPTAASLRIVAQGSPEAGAIKQTMLSKPGIPADKKPGLANYLDGAAAIMVLPKVGGKSLSSLLRKAQTQSQVDELLGIIERPKILNQIGRMSLVDAFMANEDRLNAFFSQLGIEGKYNLGNIMISADENSDATAIDNAAFRWNAGQNQGATPMKNDYSLELVQQLLANPGKQVDFFLTAMLAFLPAATEDFDPKAYVQARFNRNLALTYFAQGMHEAAQRLIAIINNKGSRASLKGVMPDQKTQWGAMRGRAQWLEALESGATEEQAMEIGNAFMISRRGSQAFRPKVEAILQVDPDLSHIPDKPKSRFSPARKTFYAALTEFEAAIGSRAQEMHGLAGEIDALLPQASGTGPSAIEAQGTLHYVVKRLGSDYGASLARMIGQFKTIWLAWMGALDAKKDAKERTKLTKIFDLLRQGQSVLMSAVDRAKAAEAQRKLALQRKELDAPQARPMMGNNPGQPVDLI
jgi:hypothetical protein